MHTQEIAVDNDLLRRLQGGDLGALGPIYERHHKLMRREIAARGVRAWDIDDVVQNVFLSLVRRVQAWAPDKDARRWLLNVCVGEARHWVRDARCESDGFDDAIRNHEPVATTQRAELAAEVGELVSRLPESQRVAVQMVYLENMTHVEASREMGVSVTASYKRVERAMAYLREVSNQE